MQLKKPNKIINMEEIRNNIRNIRKNIAKVCEEVGRDPNKITLLAATKTVPAEVINSAIDFGISCIGENRVQEFLSKYDDIDKESCEIHFIGHLQRNKVKQIIDKVNMIHSVDNLELAKDIAKYSLKKDKIMDVLVEVNIASEITKSGIAPTEVGSFIEMLKDINGIRFRGLMAIPPKSSDICKTIEYFKKMQQIWIDIKGKNVDNTNIDCLSMGMSSDYIEAIRMGANVVRVGRAIFGERVNN